jgi:hypothetical protein
MSSADKRARLIQKLIEKYKQAYFTDTPISSRNSNNSNFNSNDNSSYNQSVISFSESNSDGDEYYLEDRFDTTFYENINFEKLKSKWTIINDEICTKLNEEYLPKFKECYFY